MPYASAELLALAAQGLTGSHAFTVVTVPALLRAAAEAGQSPTELLRFGSRDETKILDEAFRLAEGRKPYLSLWGHQRTWLNNDYAGSTLQAQRTRDAFAAKVFIDDFDQEGRTRRTQFALRPDAGRALTQADEPVRKVSLGLWLGRNEPFDDLDAVVAWFNSRFPSDGTDLDGLLYLDGIPEEYMDIPWLDEPAATRQILDALGIRPPAGRGRQARQTQAAMEEAESLTWTREVCGYPLREADVGAIIGRATERIRAENIELPDPETLVRRCVVGLLVGHLVLQGPPGTGKTTLGRILAEAFGCKLVEATATSEWSPYHVVGGLRTAPSGGLEASYGKITEAALECARVIRSEIASERGQAEDETLLSPRPQGNQAVWLLIDEFNRADIDKAIGSIYTLLSSAEPEHLARTPIDLWFESSPQRKKLWVPTRFRIIGAMNDVDTSFVNQISQGLTRRFQFVTVGTPAVSSGDGEISAEVETAFRKAYSWLYDTYKTNLSVQPIDELRANLKDVLQVLTRLVSRLRSPDGVAGWPVGTAQIVDVLRAVLLERHSSDYAANMLPVLDRAVADRLVPQMGALEDDQFTEFERQFDQQSLTYASVALKHLLDPHIAR